MRISTAILILLLTDEALNTLNARQLSVRKDYEISIMRTFYIELRNGLNPKDWIDLGTPMGIRFHPTSELQDCAIEESVKEANKAA